MNDINPEQLRDVLKGVQIPSCPAILTELMAELRSKDANNAKISSLVARDVGLAAGVIKTINSPLFGMRRKISSIDEAINLLGFRRLNNMVLTELLRKSAGSSDASLERFWDNSAHTARVCSELVQFLPGVDRDTAYTFGLFHDVGIPLMVRRFPDYKAVLQRANTDPERSFTEVEEEACGTNHAAIGYFMARSWGLPEVVTQAVLSHHDYASLHRDSGLDEKSCMLIGINLIAEQITGNFLRIRADQEWAKGRSAVATYFGLSLTELDDLADDVLLRLDEERNRAQGLTSLEA